MPFPPVLPRHTARLLFHGCSTDRSCLLNGRVWSCRWFRLGRQVMQWTATSYPEASGITEFLITVPVIEDSTDTALGCRLVTAWVWFVHNLSLNLSLR